MGEDQPRKDVPEDKDEDLIDESDEVLEPDQSPEAAEEANLTEGETKPASAEDVELEDDEEGL